MRRREFITLISGAAAARPLAAQAQQPGKVPRIGFLVTASFDTPEFRATRDSFVQGMRELGWVEGQNFIVEYRSAEGRQERFPSLALDLVRMNVDLILAGATPHARAAQQATRTIPIVVPGMSDPVDDGLVASLARPGGNVTGLSNLNADLVGKCLEYFTQAVPAARRIAVLWQPGAFGEHTEKEMLKAAEVAARVLGIELQFVEARGPADIDKAFSEITGARADAVAVLVSGMLLGERQRLVDLAARNRLPVIYTFRELVDAGGLMSYGTSLADLFRRAARSRNEPA